MTLPVDRSFDGVGAYEVPVGTQSAPDIVRESDVVLLERTRIDRARLVLRIDANSIRFLADNELGERALAVAALWCAAE